MKNNNYLDMNKKSKTSKHINNNKKLFKKNNLVNKKKIKNDNNKDIKNINKEEAIINNFDRNNKVIEKNNLNAFGKNSNIVKRNNYKIKVKTKINNNDQIHIDKTFNNNMINFEDINIDDDFGDEIDYSNQFDNNLNNSNILNENNNPYFKDFCQEKYFLEKIKFIQLWWKTIFQIIKIQKHLRGFLYRQRLIEELDREEIAVDNLLYFINSYKKIVFKIFIFRLRKYNPGISYYFIKWNEITNKNIIINKLLSAVKNKSNDITNLDYEYDKNYFLRDSTNSLINNINMINDYYNKDNNININNSQEDENDNIMLCIENYNIKKKNNLQHFKFISNNINLGKNKSYINSNNSNNNINICKNNKKLKKNLYEKYNQRNSVNVNNNCLKVIQKKCVNDFKQNHHISASNPLILSTNNKMKKRIRNKTNILNRESIKSEQNKININSMTVKRIKKSNMANKLVEKDIIPFSNNNNLNNNSKIGNSLTNSTNEINWNNYKKLKIYENHLQEYKYINENEINNKENIENGKNKEGGDNIIFKNNNNKQISIPELKENSYLIGDNLFSSSIDQLKKIIYNNDSNIINNSYKQNQADNNINTVSSFNTSFLNSIKSNNKDKEIGKYFKYWFNKVYYDIIKNRLRSLYLFKKIANFVKKFNIRQFFGIFKNYYYFILYQNIKEYFIICKNRIIAKLLIKCSECKIFNKYKEIVFKKIILEKLKDYLIKNQKRIYNEIEKDIKNFNKNNYILNYPRKKVIINNDNQLYIQINPINKNNNLIINNSMLDLINPIEKFYLNQNDNKEYNNTEENQPFNFNVQNINTNKKNIDIITQTNQLTMVINLVEQLRNKNKKVSLINYFQKWKNYNNHLLHENTVINYFEEFTQPTLIDNIQSESDITKSEHLTYNFTSNNNIKSNKYVPKRGVKYFNGKIKQKNINSKKKTNSNKYKINNLIDKYKTNTILTKNSMNPKLYKKKENLENSDNNNHISDNFKTFNDYNSFDCNNIIVNNSNNILKKNDLIKKATINNFQKNNNSKNIYHRKTVGGSLKNNIGNNLNNISRINDKIPNYQYTNDSINYTLDNYGSNFLGLLNNATFIGDYNIDTIINSNNDKNKNENNSNLDYIKYNNINDVENFDIQNTYGFKKLNKIEEKEINFFSRKDNVNESENNNYENISIINEIKKYYNEDSDIYNNEEQKKKFNSFIINIFNNNIIMAQTIKTKRSKSK